MDIQLRRILAVLAAGVVLVTILPVQAATGRPQLVDQPRSSEDASPQRCERRDTYNDIYRTNCDTLLPLGASRERG